MKYKKHILFAGIASAALFASSLQAQLIVNGDFENPDFSGETQTATFPNWTVEGNMSADDDGATGRVPGVDDNQVIRFQKDGNGKLSQDLGHNWSTSETFDLSFNASETYWKAGGTGDDAISVDIYQVVGALDFSGSETDDIELWSSGIINLDGTHTGSAMPAWTAGQTFNYTIAAGTDFSGGTAGEGIYLQFRGGNNAEGNGVAYLDNVSFTVVPEPSSFALLAGCFGLTWVMLRRRA